MNKVKMFFVAAALLLVTAGVFAGKAKFLSPTNLYAYDGTHSYELSTSAPLDLSTTQIGTAAKIISSGTGTPTYGLYYYDGSTFEKLYTSGF